MLQPKVGVMDGTMATAILQWRFDDDSLWRGLSDNTKLARLARSMVSSGFLEDERSVAKRVVASLDSGRAAGGHPSGEQAAVWLHMCKWRKKRLVSDWSWQENLLVMDCGSSVNWIATAGGPPHQPGCCAWPLST